jgi:predicted glutamine amidotransferase
MMEHNDVIGAVIVSSEPLSGDPGWRIIPPNQMVLVDADRTVRIEPLDVPNR